MLAVYEESLGDHGDPLAVLRVRLRISPFAFRGPRSFHITAQICSTNTVSDVLVTLLCLEERYLYCFARFAHVAVLVR